MGREMGKEMGKEIGKEIRKEMGKEIRKEMRREMVYRLLAGGSRGNICPRKNHCHNERYASWIPFLAQTRKQDQGKSVGSSEVSFNWG